VHQHLTILHKAGLVRSRKNGRIRLCKVETSKLELVETWLADRRAAWETKLDRLEIYLNEGEES